MQTQKSMVWRVWGWLDDRYQLAPLMDALLHCGDSSLCSHLLSGRNHALFLYGAGDYRHSSDPLLSANSPKQLITASYLL